MRASGFVRRSGRDRIRKHTDRAFGASLPPHWFRDAAATSIAVEDPKHVADARHVLGHASLATTERFYNQARSLEASRRHQVMLATCAPPLSAARSERTLTAPLDRTCDPFPQASKGSWMKVRLAAQVEATAAGTVKALRETATATLALSEFVEIAS